MTEHPDYKSMLTLWIKWRSAYKGGTAFVEDYLRKFSQRETTADFADRKTFTYCAAFAKMAINDVKNAIFQRITDVQRLNGPTSYMAAVEGLNGGVDHRSSTMGSFIGREILPELLVMGKVGVFIDRQALSESATLATVKAAPYLYTYTAEQILSWAQDETKQYTSVLLKDVINTLDPETGLPDGTEDQYRLITKTAEGVEIKIYKDDEVISQVTLDLDRIPFVVFEINESLMADIADIQVALTNASSSDIAYILKANFPFYTEQTDNKMTGAHLKQKGRADDKVEVGVHHGRSYPRGLDRPGFIAPPTEPLVASMKKQDEMKEDIRRLINLALSGLQAKSAESKNFDERGLEAGLSYIGLELEHGERRIAEIWSAYEGTESVTMVKYPEKYSLKTDTVVLKEVEQLEARMMAVPSLLYKKEIAKQIVTILLGPKVSTDTLTKIKAEIDHATILTTSLDILKLSLEEGLIGRVSAAKALGIPASEVEQAKLDHAERAQRILLAQKAIGDGARGVSDTDPNEKSSTEEKGKINGNNDHSTK